MAHQGGSSGAQQLLPPSHLRPPETRGIRMATLSHWPGITLAWHRGGSKVLSTQFQIKGEPPAFDFLGEDLPPFFGVGRGALVGGNVGDNSSNASMP